MRRFEITQERVTEVCQRFVSDFRGSSLITPPGQLRQRRSKYSPRRISIVQCGRINVRFRGRYLDALHEEQFECSIKPGNRQNRVKWSNYSIRGEPFVRITVVAITVIARGT